jgi:hypothetical protein
MMTPALTVRRRGFSLTVVLLFLLLLMYLWAVVYRSTGSLVRAQTARIQRDIDDAGMRNALAQVLMYLERQAGNGSLDTNSPPPPYTVTVNNDPVVESGIAKKYTATITPPGPGKTDWKVEVGAYDASKSTQDLPTQ